MVAGAHDLWLFVVTVFVLNATPGVDMMLTASRTLQHGIRGGLATALGVNAGCVVHTLVTAFGLAALFFLALLPQFIDVQAPDKTAAFLFLGAVTVLQSLLFLAGFVVMVASLRRLQPRPAVRRAVQGSGGLVLLFLSARLALTQRP